MKEQNKAGGKELKEALGAWLEKFDWDYWATFTFKYSVQNPINAKKYAERFLNRFGLDAFYCVERFYLSGDCHLHALLGNAGGMRYKKMYEEWAKRYGRCWFSEYDRDKKARFYVTKYVTKDLYDWDIKFNKVKKISFTPRN